MSKKRINLYFDLSRSDDKIAYETIIRQRHKTDYIIKLILRNTTVSTEDIRAIFKEVIEEYKFTSIINKDDKSYGVPNEIFELFDQM